MNIVLHSKFYDCKTWPYCHEIVGKDFLTCTPKVSNQS